MTDSHEMTRHRFTDRFGSGLLASSNSFKLDPDARRAISLISLDGDAVPVSSLIEFGRLIACRSALSSQRHQPEIRHLRLYALIWMPPSALDYSQASGFCQADFNSSQFTSINVVLAAEITWNRLLPVISPICTRGRSVKARFNFSVF